MAFTEWHQHSVLSEEATLKYSRFRGCQLILVLLEGTPPATDAELEIHKRRGGAETTNVPLGSLVIIDMDHRYAHHAVRVAGGTRICTAWGLHGTVSADSVDAYEAQFASVNQLN